MQIPMYKWPHTFIFLLPFGSSSPLLYHLPPSVFQTKPRSTASSPLSPLQDGGRECHAFRPEVKRCWIWGAAVSDLLQWLLSLCLSIPISAAFLHSWEMCLLPCTLCCWIWTSPCWLGTSRMHMRSQRLPPPMLKQSWIICQVVKC